MGYQRDLSIPPLPTTTAILIDSAPAGFIQSNAQFLCEKQFHTLKFFGRYVTIFKLLLCSLVMFDFSQIRVYMNSRFSQTEGSWRSQGMSFHLPLSRYMLRQSSLPQLFGSPTIHGKYVKFLPVTLETNVPSVAASVPSINMKLFETSANQIQPRPSNTLASYC